jgi:hypothetical protein
VLHNQTPSPSEAVQPSLTGGMLSLRPLCRKNYVHMWRTSKLVHSDCLNKDITGGGKKPWETIWLQQETSCHRSNMTHVSTGHSQSASQSKGVLPSRSRVNFWDVRDTSAVRECWELIARRQELLFFCWQ